MRRPSDLLSSRRAFLGAMAGGAVLLGDGAAEASRLAARPPRGFVPLGMPGKVVKVSGASTLAPNGLFPTQTAARAMLERAMAELTGLADLGAAFGRFVHPADRVAVKLTGVAGAGMASNRELVAEVVRGVVAAGVPPASIVLYEQFPAYLASTRCADRAGVVDAAFPAGVRAVVHENRDAVMPEIQVNGTTTRFVRALTEATAVINVSLIKDHARFGYTGCLKNVTHGSMVNPHDFHTQHARGHVAMLYAQDVVQSRVRLHIVDGFKLIYDEGPMDRNRHRKVPHEAVYATTDPVAMDVLGWMLVEEHRKNNGLPTLEEAGRAPAYIRTAGDLGLGIADPNRIRLREVKL